ncbi:MAG TPA: hypothetical protein QGF58_20025 [Myxococcota bacterium]|nr:hypothetical protein [Myxococcota bacterium]
MNLFDQCRDPGTSPERLAEIAGDPCLHPTIGRQLARNPSVPERELLRLGQEFPAELLQNPLWDLWMLADPGFLDRLPLRTAMSLAGCDATPTAVIRRLAGARSRPVPVRARAACNPSTPPELLHDYMKHAREVRRALATNPRLDPRLHPRLARDSWSPVRGAIAARRDIDPALLVKLASDRSVEHVRAAVAGNPRTPARILLRLCNSTAGSVLHAIAANRGAPDALRARARTNGRAAWCGLTRI